MQTSVARTSSLLRSVAAGSGARTSAVRGFASSVSRGQAVPSEKPVLTKEFKIYRWVGGCVLFKY